MRGGRGQYSGDCTGQFRCMSSVNGILPTKGSAPPRGASAVPCLQSLLRCITKRKFCSCNNFSQRRHRGGIGKYAARTPNQFRVGVGYGKNIRAQMAGVTGFEPATSGLTGRHSKTRLSYTPALVQGALCERAVL